MLTKLIKYILPILILIQLYFSIQYVSSDISKGDSFILDIKGKCNENFDHKLILARKPHIAYYLNANFRPLQYFTNETEFLNQMKDVDYFYCGGFEFRMLDKNVNWLNNEMFETVCVEKQYIIFKINKESNNGQ